ncbi:ketopantoate hydroxymethyltransferase [Rhodothalassium salexigens DSM 2132]|uniref:3-methyl-2-oxobutanoate hydroxymethyltransferase n=2 Tax=Rhodothalassium salexigens TaxID=1086 RepID=A0A4R2PTR6_RHOSA|nr:3-methyl-2-oxobutanoate hydroxymethyltransferase [Rhodothalassium salexigens]MBB4210254.1 3-methyl-2-oxobutanoate hydroxymethyltransferase [Rhodothalassium salexigens DSM 2132]MBK1638775.1 3-methyl-2-oxobutanoate hydroxymethyltransferase [Rhodothalassium salexigens DSM 2132]TCP38418.1 ketopantoate hydroxymethyltransferase [Rhodothalassium salexigens DSM 2132]
MSRHAPSPDAAAKDGSEGGGPTKDTNPPAASKPRMTVPRFRARKRGEPLVCLTAYTYPMARLLDPLCDLLLVGDSLAMVVHGLDSTVPLDLDLLLAHARAVRRGAETALMVVDLPFGSYEASPTQAFETACRVMKETGAQAVKLEGGTAQAATVRFLVDRGIPVMGHVGLRPQSVHLYGGYGAHGRNREDWQPIIDDAYAVADAGAFGVVVEGVAEPLAREITEALAVPVIGIGASAACDGQVLVIDDMLGMFDRAPKFVKRYAALGDEITRAVSAYAEDVRARRFPGPDQTYGLKDDGGRS